MVSIDAFAQKQTIKGVVVDATSKEPIAGAALMVKGTSTGTDTGIDGTYALAVKNGDVIVCQFFGYKTQEITFNGQSKIDFVLVEDSETLEATVVVGYGTLKKTQLVGAVENLDGEALENRPTTNVSRSLQGQVAGLNIISVDGKATHQGKIYVRGGSTSYNTRSSGTSASGTTHSIGQGGSALVLIDGVEGDLASVNPEDVQTVSVLKDAASAAVYGARGSYGVILVTTKNASKDRVSVNYNGSVSVNQRLIMWEDYLVSNGLEWADNFIEFFQGDGRTPTSSGTYPSTINSHKAFSKSYYEELKRRYTDSSYEKYIPTHPEAVWETEANGNYVYYGSTDWVSEFYKRQYTSQTHNVTVSGSSDRTSFSVSGRFYTQDGIYKVGRENYQTYSIRSKGSVKITDWATLSNNTYVYHMANHEPMISGSDKVLMRQFDIRCQPLYPIYNEDGSLTYAGASAMYDGWVKDEVFQDDEKLQLTTTTTLDLQPIKNVLDIKADFTYKAKREERTRLSSSQTGYNGIGAPQTYNTNSYKSTWDYNTNYIVANVVGTWTPKLGDNHDLNLMAGWNLEKSQYRRFYFNRNGVIYPQVPSFELFDTDVFKVEDNGNDKSMVGVFGRLNYTLLKRYIFEFAARYDGSSLFPSNQQWGFFPSGSFGWRVSEEPWMKWSRSWLDNLKIRANYGSLGNANIDPYYFLETMSIAKTSILIDGEKRPYTTAASIIPKTLTWETVTTWDVGFDMDILKNRLSVSADYYDRATTDLLVAGPAVPAVLGAGAPKGNFGALDTRGWEATISWRDSFKLGGKDFIYSFKGSVWDSTTWVTEYNNATGAIYSYYNGKELGEIWGFRTAGIFKSNEEANNWVPDTFHKNGQNFREYAGDLKFIDVNGDNQIGVGKVTLDDHGDLERIGNETPHYQFGVNMDFRWNGIGLSLFFQGVGKRDWYPDCETGLFWGMYNRPYAMYPSNHDNRAHLDYSTENWVVTNWSEDLYWTRAVGYCANRNVGPLQYENDHYLLNAAYCRLKNLTLDYTLPSKWTKKANIEKVKIYFSGENLFTFTPLYKYTKMFDPEVITNGDSDFTNNDYGLSGTGQGYSYPMTRTLTLGLNLTF